MWVASARRRTTIRYRPIGRPFRVLPRRRLSCCSSSSMGAPATTALTGSRGARGSTAFARSRARPVLATTAPTLRRGTGPLTFGRAAPIVPAVRLTSCCRWSCWLTTHLRTSPVQGDCRRSSAWPAAWSTLAACLWSPPRSSGRHQFVQWCGSRSIRGRSSRRCLTPSLVRSLLIRPGSLGVLPPRAASARGPMQRSSAKTQAVLRVRRRRSSIGGCGTRVLR